MWSRAHDVAAGDTVIIWLVSTVLIPLCILIAALQTRDLIQPLVVTPGKDFNTKFGNFRQADFVGVPYGSKIPSRTGRGFLLILRPTPELWTLALPHRTQILYLADNSFITSALNIKKGSRVIEAGMFTVTEIRDQRAGI
jgi:tRNA (adenine57-N1/adenine58-N1)-methyltransferase catalytic subunit